LFKGVGYIFLLPYANNATNIQILAEQNQGRLLTTLSFSL